MHALNSLGTQFSKITHHNISSMYFYRAIQLLPEKYQLKYSTRGLDIPTTLKLQSSNKTYQERFYKNGSDKNILNLQATFLPLSKICRDVLTLSAARVTPQICLFCYIQTYNRTTHIQGNLISSGSPEFIFSKSQLCWFFLEKKRFEAIYLEHCQERCFLGPIHKPKCICKKLSLWSSSVSSSIFPGF